MVFKIAEWENLSYGQNCKYAIFLWNDKWIKAKTYTNVWAGANGLASWSWVWEEKEQKIRDKEVWDGSISMDMGMSTKYKYFSTINWQYQKAFTGKESQSTK